jgi:DNA gyrase subunit A
LNKLYKFTALQTAFNVNNIALVKGRPMMLNLKDLIRYFVEHRHEVVIRRTQYDLDQAEKKAHILRGLIIAIDNLDAVISIIRAAKTPDEARENLCLNFELDDIQARAILDLRLQKLTGLERDKIHVEYTELCKMIEWYQKVLAEEPLRMQIIKDELAEIKTLYGDQRKTEIVYASEEFNPEDFYADEDMVITISHMGYIKRTPLTEFRTQSRGGIGSKGSSTRDEDFLEHMFIATMHNTLLLFTEKGKCFWLKVYEIPEGTKISKGRAIQNLLSIEPDDQVRAYINVKSLKDEEYINNNFIILCTKKGTIKKTSLEAYSRPRQNGVNAITIRENDQLLEAKLTNGENEIMLAVKSGKAIRFHESHARAIGRTASGVRGITLGNDADELVGMVCVTNEEDNILVVSEHGYGKRSRIEDYRVTNRGGKGVKTINITEKTGALVSIKNVTDGDDLMIITEAGVTIRLPVGEIRMTGRAAQGVKLINLREDDCIASVARVEIDEIVDLTDENIVDSDENESEDNQTEENLN